MRLFDDDEPILRLARARNNRGRKGVHWGRSSVTMVATDPPSPPIARFRKCPRGCQCHRCSRDKACLAQQFRECRQFRGQR